MKRSLSKGYHACNNIYIYGEIMEYCKKVGLLLIMAVLLVVAFLIPQLP
ncbi:hypothetical protein NC653_038677 [Populus alba x Populus x berolinensis]|uniref:Uncharacterized protein n=1 Tax=Populus alba x Populus x berolinensis TaxID=444605 RepID=A0AAD6PUI5_9ROSI|nr:hypothetical protein NC653_038677 [Populus alba x Populus x berolinensis]